MIPKMVLKSMISERDIHAQGKYRMSTLSFIGFLGEKYKMSALSLQCESSFGEGPGDWGWESGWCPDEGTKFHGSSPRGQKMYPPLTAAHALELGGWQTGVNTLEFQVMKEAVQVGKWERRNAGRRKHLGERKSDLGTEEIKHNSKILS